MAGTLQTRQFVATALNAVFSGRSTSQEKLGGVLELSNLLNRGLSAVGVCVVDSEDVRGSREAVFASVDRRSTCRRPFVYAPESAEQAWNSIRPIVNKVGRLASAQGADLRGFITSVLNAAASDEGLSARRLGEFPTVEVVSGNSEDSNGDLTIVLIAVGIVAFARRSDASIPLPSITGEPAEGMTPEQIKLFNQLSETVDLWVSGALPWLTDFLTCISIMKFFENHAGTLNPDEKTIFLLLRRQTYAAMKEYENAFVLFQKMNLESATASPEDFQKVFDGLEVNLLDAEAAESLIVGGAAGVSAGVGLKFLNFVRAVTLPIPIKVGAFIFGASFAASDYADAVTDQFSQLASCWKKLSRAYDLRDVNPTESRRLLSQLGLTLSERCRIGSKAACYMRLGAVAGVSVFAYYKWLQFSNNQLTSS